MLKSDLLTIAVKAAIKAGEEIMQIYHSGDFGIDIKSDSSPLTVADKASHNIITSYLEKTDIPVLSEEGRDIPFDTRKNWERLWIVDPIDGTKEFIKKNGEFTVNIALIENNTPVLGVVYAPALNEMFYSTDEIGSYEFLDKLTDVNLNLEDLITKSRKLNASQTTNLSEKEAYTIVASRSHMSSETQDYISKMESKYGQVQLISRGSSLKLCMVAQGKANCYPRFAPTMEWDTAAGQAICLNAGYDVMDWKTRKTMKYNRSNLLNNWFLVN